MYRSVLFLLIAVGFAGCAEPQPPEFLSKEHRFRVRFGSPPKVYDQPDNGIPTQLFTVVAPNGAYTVRAYELPVPADAAAQTADRLLDEAKGDLLRSVGGTPTAGESVVLAGKYPGRAFAATAARPQPGLLRGRIYLAGTRLYKVTVFGAPDFVNSPDATAFLDSFMIVE
ncbi:MAG: hypothetical protein J0I06_15020 [Planctomycetes bacterium]|nr:hypothetical protein [Planctomycetota bacterium]